MKIYQIMGNCFGPTNGIHSSYLSEQKAKEKSNQMRKELYQFKLAVYMDTHKVSEDVARECIHFPDWLYEVKELEVEE